MNDPLSHRIDRCIVKDASRHCIFLVAAALLQIISCLIALILVNYIIFPFCFFGCQKLSTAPLRIHAHYGSSVAYKQSSERMQWNNPMNAIALMVGTQATNMYSDAILCFYFGWI